jgi:hypothetical protein
MCDMWRSQHSKTKTSDSVELFQLMRSDFEAVMERFPILKTRLAQIGQARVRRASAEPDFGSRAAGSRMDSSPEPERSTRSSKSPERASTGAPGEKKSKGKSKACHQQ